MESTEDNLPPFSVSILTHDFPPMGGGISAYAYGLLRAFETMAFNCRVHFFPLDRNVASPSPQVTTFPIPARSTPFRTAACCMGLLRNFKALQKSRLVVVVTWAPVGIAYRFFARVFRSRSVLLAHGNDILEPSGSGRYRYLMRKVFGSYSAVCTNSRYTADLCRKVTGRCATAIGAGVEELFFQSPVLAKTPGTEPFTLLSVGRLVERKGFDQVLRSLADVRSEMGDWRYLIVGDGPYRPVLERLRRELKLDPHVRLLGRVSKADLIAFYRLADLFIMTSRTVKHTGDVEGLGLVYMEAGAAGIPVVAGDSGGVRDVVENEVNGLLVDPRSTASIGSAVLRLYRDPELRRRLGSNGRRLAETRWRWIHTAQRLLSAAGVGNALSLVEVKGGCAALDDAPPSAVEKKGCAPASVRAAEKRQSAKVCYLRARRMMMSLALPHAGRKGVVPDLETVNRVLVVAPPRIGDAAIATAALRQFTEAYPHVTIHVLANDYVAQLLSMAPSIDRIVSFPGTALGLWRTVYRLKARQPPYEVVFDLNADRFLKTAAAARLLGNDSIGYDDGAGRGRLFSRALGPPSAKTHMAEVYAAVFGLFFPRQTALRPSIRPGNDSRMRIRMQLDRLSFSSDKKWVMIHVGAHHPTQRWPTAYFAAVADALMENPRRQLILGAGPGEQSLLKAVCDRMKKAPHAIFCGGSLDQLAGLIEASDILICNNSGPLHIAAGIGTITVSTMGPTQKERWMPLGEGHEVLRCDELPCIGCNLGYCRIGTHDCMRKITPVLMSRRVERRLREDLPPDHGQKAPG